MAGINKDHFLIGDEVTQMECNKNQEKFLSGMPDTIIIHFTAGRDALSSAKYMCRPDIKASAHIVIGRDGGIIQLVPFNIISWHSGLSAYNNRVGFNKFSIGIELDNAGEITKKEDKYYSWFERRYPESEVIKAIHRNQTKEKYWHKYTDAQIDTTESICQLLMEKYYNIKEILGHEEIASDRKVDPGPAFPLDEMRKRLLDSSNLPFNNL